MHHVNERRQAQRYKLSTIVDWHNNAYTPIQVIDLSLRKICCFVATQCLIRQDFFAWLALVDRIFCLIS